MGDLKKKKPICEKSDYRNVFCEMCFNEGVVLFCILWEEFEKSIVQ